MRLRDARSSAHEFHFYCPPASSESRDMAAYNRVALQHYSHANPIRNSQFNTWYTTCTTQTKQNTKNSSARSTQSMFLILIFNYLLQYLWLTGNTVAELQFMLIQSLIIRLLFVHLQCASNYTFISYNSKHPDADYGQYANFANAIFGRQSILTIMHIIFLWCKHDGLHTVKRTWNA